MYYGWSRFIEEKPKKKTTGSELTKTKTTTSKMSERERERVTTTEKKNNKEKQQGLEIVQNIYIYQNREERKDQ